MDNELGDLAKLFTKKISIDICWDIQRKIKTINFNDFPISEYYKKYAEKIKKLRSKIQDYTNKNLIIIQSSYTNLFDVISEFPEGKIISKADPIQEFACIIKRSGNEELENLYLNISNQIKEFQSNQEYISDNTAKRLKISEKDQRATIDSFNCYKLIKEFKKKRIPKTIDKYNLIFNIYKIN